MITIDRSTLIEQLDKVITINSLVWFLELEDVEIYRIGRILKKSVLNYRYKNIYTDRNNNKDSKLLELQTHLSKGEVLEVIFPANRIVPISIKMQDGDRNYHQQSFLSFLKRCRQLGLTPPSQLTTFPFIAVKESSPKQLLEVVDQIKPAVNILCMIIESPLGTRVLYYQ